MNKVLQLRGVNFEWEDTERQNEGLEMGFIAQEAKDIIPEVVNYQNDHYSMQYAPLTALLLKAIKEQQKQIEELKEENSRISDLEKIIYDLQVQVSILMSSEK